MNASYMNIACIIIIMHRIIYKDISVHTGNLVATTNAQTGVIHHQNCQLLLPASTSIRCINCNSFRATLRTLRSRSQKKSTSTTSRTAPNSCVPYSVLSREEMMNRMRNLHDQFTRIQKRYDRLKQLVDTQVQASGVTVDEDLHSYLKEMILNEGEKQMEKARPNTFKRIFWEQQLQAASTEDHRGMRWHPLVIRWCIYLRHQSQGAYETLRQSGCITLPSQRTLRDYTHYVKAVSGFSSEIDRQLYQAAKLDECKEMEKYVILLLDEMHIKESLVYDKHSGELIGYTELGDINTHLTTLERSLTGESPSLASTVMSFMVRGLFSKLQFPYAHFPCHQITGDLLYDPFWEAVFRLERSGFKVLYKCSL